MNIDISLLTIYFFNLWILRASCNLCFCIVFCKDRVKSMLSIKSFPVFFAMKMGLEHFTWIMNTNLAFPKIIIGLRILLAYFTWQSILAAAEKWPRIAVKVSSCNSSSFLWMERSSHSKKCFWAWRFLCKLCTIKHKPQKSARLTDKFNSFKLRKSISIQSFYNTSGWLILYRINT